MLHSKIQKQSLFGFVEPSLRTEQTSVILSLRQPSAPTKPLLYRIETRDQNEEQIVRTKEVLMIDGAEICSLNNSIRVAINPNAISLFEQHQIEEMVLNSLAGFNLCLFLLGNTSNACLRLTP